MYTMYISIHKDTYIIVYINPLQRFPNVCHSRFGESGKRLENDTGKRLENDTGKRLENVSRVGPGRFNSGGLYGKRLENDYWKTLENVDWKTLGTR